MDDDTPLVSPESHIQHVCKKRGWDLNEVTLSPTVVIAMPLFMGIFTKWVEKVEKSVVMNHYKNQKGNVSVVEARMGAPLMAAALEEMIALRGSRFIHLGFAGGLDSQLTIGDIVVTRGALNETGVPALYGIDDLLIPSDLCLTDALIDAAATKKLPILSGIHWCTDAPYRETWGKVKNYTEKGALCVEMEGAALFSVSHYYGVPAAAVYVITDVVGKDGWQQTWHSTDIIKACTNVVNLVISFVKRG